MCGKRTWQQLYIHVLQDGTAHEQLTAQQLKLWQFPLSSSLGAKDSTAIKAVLTYVKAGGELGQAQAKLELS